MPRFKSIFNLFTLVALLASLIGSAVTYTDVRAASLVVTKAADTNDYVCDADCSLREAIYVANNTPGDDTITFAGDFTITLNQALSNPILYIQYDGLTITGNGEANTIIEGSACNPVTLPGSCTPSSYDVFRVFSPLTLNNLTVRHGGNHAIYNVQSTVNVTNSTITANASRYPGYPSSTEGAGIYNSQGTVTITNSTISDNLSEQSGSGDVGAGIANYLGTITINDSVITGNNTEGYAGGGLGGSGVWNISNSIISNNQASNSISSYGGGIYNAGTMTISGSTISNNSSSAAGGGIANFGGLTITDSVVSDNSTATTINIPASKGGGGIYNRSGSPGSLPSSNTLTVTNTTFENNDAYDEHGGAIYTDFAGKISISGSTFIGNSAKYGGAVSSYIENGYIIQTSITNSTFYNNTATYDADGYGGAIYNGIKDPPVIGSNTYANTNFTITNSTIVGNEATYGGGIFSDSPALNVLSGTTVDIALRNSIVYGNTASGSGINCGRRYSGTLTGDANNIFDNSGVNCPVGSSDLAISGVINTVVASPADNGGATQTMSLPGGLQHSTLAMPVYVQQLTSVVYPARKGLGVISARLNIKLPST